MTAPNDTETVRMPTRYLWLLRLGTPLLGAGLGSVVDPVVGWLLATTDSAPGPLQLLAEIPAPWAILLLTAVGAVAGIWLAQQAQRDGLAVTAGADGLVLAHRGDDRFLDRTRIGSVHTDPRDLVVLDTDGREVFRGPAVDLPTARLATVLRRHGYPWSGTRDPHEERYRGWVDGHPDLGERTHVLLRDRRAALESGDRAEAGRLHRRLQEGGVVVRDRGKKQQYRLLGTG
ncbi:hypothetical protein IQ251_04270 [Saccharopolyspora sp. HNM0983]|uniref:Uncharacterized protein n=1 Tax=Saccharopolyspora montiporae TaxID=2781240 RepID=A0A929B924_9PSEU|nr:hypothetical protein [Saccharopolyspora sp. HNM0983]MBE9373661.1 hypothetical protein [Saccharopolyspora sp. HNM0983]